MYYFQFTITPYSKDIEPNLPSKNDEILLAFKNLSKMIGTDRVIWRYDPILISEKYTVNYHIRAFEKIAKELHKYTRKVTISFIDDDYRCVKNKIKELGLLDFSYETQIELSSQLAEIAHSYELVIDTCAEEIELQKYGIEHARCIDDILFAKLLGCSMNVGKDKTQRLGCGCVASIDIGMYNTCRNGCLYCYANYSNNAIDGNFAKRNSLSPLISGEVGENDKIKEREVKPCRNAQMQFFTNNPSPA